MKEDLKFSILGSYVTHDMDDTAGDTKYYGFLSQDGSWYIMKSVLTVDQTSYRYCRGNATKYQTTGTDYATKWAARASLTYGLLSAIWS